MSNIDFEIGKGNEAAVAIRFHVAQHAFLTPMDFRVGSGLAALYQVGNEAEDLHFYGGRAAVLLPVNYWNNGEFKDQLDLNTYAYTTLPEMFLADVSAPKPREYLAPDGSLFLAAGRVFQQGPADEISGWRFSDNLDTYGLVKAHPGPRVYVSSESEDRTYSALVRPDGTLGDLKRFSERGGESVATDTKGNVYVPNGEIFVYNSAGIQIGEIEVPERPIDLVFGGLDGDTLFILSHHALFSVQIALR